MLFLRGGVGYVALLLVLWATMQVGARGAARLLGLPRFRWFATRPVDAPRWRRFAVRLISSLAPLLVCVAMLWTALFYGGESVATTTIEVMPGPAQEAGMVDGDRIVSIEGVNVDSWEAIRATATPGHADRSIEVERFGERRVLLVHATADGRIGVRPRYRRQGVGAGAAFRRALVAQVNLGYQTIQRIFRLRDESLELTGPVGIVRATEGQADFGSFVVTLGLLGTTICPWLWGVHLFDALTLALFVATHAGAPSGAEPESSARLCRLYQALGIALACSLGFLLLVGLLKVPLVSAVVAPFVLLTMPAAVSVYPLAWITARERWHATAPWVAPTLAVGSIVPCVGQVAALELLLWLRQALRREGYALGWFVATRPGPEASS